eukprot:2837418-Rhodomonas_salina.1
MLPPLDVTLVHPEGVFLTEAVASDTAEPSNGVMLPTLDVTPVHPEKVFRTEAEASLYDGASSDSDGPPPLCAASSDSDSDDEAAMCFGDSPGVCDEDLDDSILVDS